MTVSGISSQNSALLLQLLGSQSNAASQSAGTASAMSQASLEANQSSDPAYQLSLGQQQINQGILGYGQLGKLVHQADRSLTEAQKDLRPFTASDGNGKFPSRTHSIDVTQLALGQQVTSAGYADSSATSLGSGTLTVSANTGESYDIEIKDGTLSGIAKAINESNIGITAKVLLGEDGQYRLEVTGPTGTENSFKLAGISALAYDPESEAPGIMKLTQASRNALYTVDGGNMQTSLSNTATTAEGFEVKLSALGTVKASVPIGFDNALDASRTLASSLDGLLSNVDALTAESGLLESSGDAAQAFKAKVLTALQQRFSHSASLSGLSDVGIVSQPDGTISFDQSKLQTAYTANPEGVRDLLSHFAGAVHEALTGSSDSGANTISQQIDRFTDQLTSKLSLMDFLYPSGGTDSASSFTGAFDMTESKSSTSNAMLDAFNSM